MAMVGLLTILAVVQTGSLFSADAWNNVTYTAGEVRNPKRNLPALACPRNVGRARPLHPREFCLPLALPLHGDPHGTTIAARGIQYASEDRVATAALQLIFSRAGAYLMAGAILISTFGCANGLTLAGARVYYAMSRDGLFFKAAGKLHPRWHTPVAALIVQAVWTCLLCISGSYGQLLDYIICTELIFYILTIALPLRAAREAPQRRAALPRHRLSRAARDLYFDGRMDLYRIIALQTAIHMAGTGDRAAGCARFRRVVSQREPKILSPGRQRA